MFQKSPAIEHAALVVVMVGLLMGFAVAQTADTRQLDSYRYAVTLAPGPGRTAALERFVAVSPASSLQRDALQFLTWEYLRLGNWSKAGKTAGEVLQTNSDDALALSVVAQQIRQTLTASKRTGELLRVARHGLATLEALRIPEGMSTAEFAELKRYAYGLLTASAGGAYLRSGEFASAREFLRRAAEQLPDDIQTAYDLGLADLNGPRPNRPEGYWYLARAVNLSAKTAGGRDIAEYARKRYRDDGGSDAAWNEFVVATATSRSATRASLARSKAPRATLRGTTDSSSRRAALPGTAGLASGTEEANPGPIHRPVARAGEPVSLGILIETAMASKENRAAIFRSLNEIVRGLGPNDEAFVLSFSHDLVFEEDLTGDSRRLQQAMDRIQPESGTALMDAVGFAAGHLQRIAKNPNRVLLVISDGRNASSRASPLEVSSQIRSSEVRIYCIGMGIDSGEAMNRLQALASGTGGQAAFISGPRQFSSAARNIARNMGIVPAS